VDAWQDRPQVDAVPSLSTYALFIATALVLLAIPGPAVLYVVSRSIDQGRRAGLVSVLGISSGTVVHVTAAAVGLSSLVLASRVAFDAVRYAGAAYLVFLGLRRLLSRGEEEGVEIRAPRTLRRLYTQGLIVNLLNPKTIVFIFAFIPQFVDVGAGHVGLQVLLLGLTFAALGLTSDSLYALAAGTIADRVRGTPLVARVERWFGGTVLVGLGLTAALVGPHSTSD
jgi:threonine/homoserine/homoserine lactone efflux protein